MDSNPNDDNVSFPIPTGKVAKKVVEFLSTMSAASILSVADRAFTRKSVLSWMPANDPIAPQVADAVVVFNELDVKGRLKRLLDIKRVAP